MFVPHPPIYMYSSLPQGLFKFSPFPYLYLLYLVVKNGDPIALTVFIPPGINQSPGRGADCFPPSPAAVPRPSSLRGPWRHLSIEPHGRDFKEGTFGSHGGARAELALLFTRWSSDGERNTDKEGFYLEWHCSLWQFCLIILLQYFPHYFLH